MSNFIITTKNAVGEIVPLKGTVWAFSMFRASQYATKEQAASALLRAKPFIKNKTFKASVIEEISAEMSAAFIDMAKNEEAHEYVEEDLINRYSVTADEAKLILKYRAA